MCEFGVNLENKLVIKILEAAYPWQRKNIMY